MTYFEKSTGFLVSRTARSMKRNLDAKLSKFGVTSSQAHVLCLLANHNGYPLSTIGEKVYLDKPAITGLADRLENDQLVERRRSTDDRRVVKLFITSKGLRTVKKLENIIENTDDDLMSVLSTIEHEKFKQMLENIWQNTLTNAEIKK